MSNMIRDAILSRLEEFEWTHYQLSQESGVSTQQISRLVSGERSMNIETASKLLLALGLKVA